MRDFQTALAAHVARLQAATDAKYTKWYPSLQPDELPSDTITTGEPGRRYIRVIRTQGAQRSVVHFIEIATGQIWKAKSWKGPIRNFPRGNIYEEAS